MNAGRGGEMWNGTNSQTCTFRRRNSSIFNLHIGGRTGWSGKEVRGIRFLNEVSSSNNLIAP